MEKREKLIMKILTLPNLREKLLNCDVIVCGLGTSLNQLDNPEKYWTVGVNDIGGKFTPDFLVCIDPLTRFKNPPSRRQNILNCNPKYFCSQLEPKQYPNLRAENYVKFKLGRRTGVGFDFIKNPERLDYHNTSTYVALNLAAYMGTKTIGLIGVDFTNDHFNRNSGVHQLSRRVDEINKQYKKFAEQCKTNNKKQITNQPIT